MDPEPTADEHPTACIGLRGFLYDFGPDAADRYALLITPRGEPAERTETAAAAAQYAATPPAFTKDGTAYWPVPATNAREERPHSPEV